MCGMKHYQTKYWLNVLCFHVVVCLYRCPVIGTLYIYIFMHCSCSYYYSCPPYVELVGTSDNHANVLQYVYVCKYVDDVLLTNCFTYELFFFY